MTHNVVYARGNRAEVRHALQHLQHAARRGGAIADAMMTRVGLAVLARIKEAFVVKSRGGVDEAGESWRALSPKTIAYSRTRQRGRGGRTRAESGRPTRPSQALNAAQQARWWEVYRRQLAISGGNKGHAAAAAWLVLKGEGAQTLLDKYGGRKVEILRDTGLLLNSLSPGVPSADRVFRVGYGEVTVGTNRRGAREHHEGTKRVPQRRLWPDPRRWPASWWQDVAEQVRQGMVDLTVLLLKETPGI